MCICTACTTKLYRGVTGYLKLGGQVVMRRVAAARRHLLFCLNLGGQLRTLPTRQLRPCLARISCFKPWLGYLAAYLVTLDQT